MGRKKARDNAFKCVYQISFYNEQELDMTNIIDECFEENENDKEEKEYIENVVIGIKENLSSIDNKILENLKNWTIDRIAKIDLAILRLATYELLFMKDVPVKVIANEAVELAKSYGNEKSANFVNGLIAKLISDSNINV